MAKEKAAKRGAISRTPTIASLRAKVDRVDQELVRLMNDRAQLALEIGKVKSTSGISAYAPAREDEVLSRLRSLRTGPLADRCGRAVFREIISGSRSLEKDLRVAYLGPA